LPWLKEDRLHVFSSLSTLLDQDVEHLAILIHGAPQVVLPSPYLDEHFVDVPGIAEPVLPALECSAVARSELQAPAAYRSRTTLRSHGQRSAALRWALVPGNRRRPD
jgi:hypothetical protein